MSDSDCETTALQMTGFQACQHGNDDAQPSVIVARASVYSTSAQKIHSHSTASLCMYSDVGLQHEHCAEQLEMPQVNTEPEPAGTVCKCGKNGSIGDG